jgi:hypothetical protein
MIRPTLAAMLLLSACATPQGIRTHGKPFFAGFTNKPPQEAAGCTSTAWGRTRGFNVRTTDINGRISVIASGSSVAGSDMVADFASDGTVTMNVRHAAWRPTDDRLRDALVECL